MADDLIPKSQAYEGGHKGTANKKPKNKRPQKPKKNLTPTHTDGFAEPKPSTIVGGVLFLVIEACAWILWQMCDGLNGYILILVHWLSFICLSAGPLPLAWNAIKLENRFWLWLLYAFVSLLLGGLAGVIWRPHVESAEMKIPFTFSLLSPEIPGNSLLLTNDILVNAPWNGSTNTILGCVLIPIQSGKSNFVLRLGVGSSAFAEKPEVRLTLLKDWAVAPDSDWEPIIDYLGFAKGYAKSNNVLIPKELTTFEYRSRIDLLPGDGLVLPDILFTNLAELTLNPSVERSKQLGSIAIMVEAKGLPLAHTEFRPFFLPVSNGYSLKPVVVTAFPTNSFTGVWFPFPRKESNDLQK